MKKVRKDLVAETFIVGWICLSLIGLGIGGYAVFQNRLDAKLPVLNKLLVADILILSAAVCSILVIALETSKGRKLFNFRYVQDNYTLLKFFIYMGVWSSANLFNVRDLMAVNMKASYLSFTTFQLTNIYSTIFMIGSAALLAISAIEVAKIMTENRQNVKLPKKRQKKSFFGLKRGI